MNRSGAILLLAGSVAVSCGGKAIGDSPEPTNAGGRGSAGSGSFGGSISYPPIGACFGKGTRIATATGSVAIEDVKVGDRVQAFDLGTGTVVDELVTEVFVHPRQPVGELRTAGGTLRVTANHPIYDAAARRFVAAGSLSEPFQALELASNWSTSPSLLSGFVPRDQEQTVYNFTVANVHTYFAEGLLVHNKERCGYPGDPPDCPCLPDECVGTSSGGISGRGSGSGSGGSVGGANGGMSGGDSDGGAGGELGGSAGLAGESFAGGTPSSDAGAGGA